MQSVSVRIIGPGEELPAMACGDFFHSAALRDIMTGTPGWTPYVAVAEDAGGRCLARLLVTIRQRSRWSPLHLFRQGQVYGEGAYAEGADRERLFPLLLEAITVLLRRKLCLFVEFSNLSAKMFGYRHFRACGYFPVSWQEIHNSLHSREPRERLTERMSDRIERARQRGVVTRRAETPAEVRALYKILRGYYRSKIRKIIPPRQLLEAMFTHANARIHVTLLRDKVIGGSVCVYSQGNAWLWFLASRRKSYATLHPNTLTVWQAIESAHADGCAHIYFLDAGLPFYHNPFREFILRFGGKPVTKYRWFRFFVPGLGRLLAWLFRA